MVGNNKKIKSTFIICPTLLGNMQITKLSKCFVQSIMILQEGSICLGRNEFFFNIYNLPGSLIFKKLPKIFWNMLEKNSLEFFQAL